MCFRMGAVFAACVLGVSAETPPVITQAKELHRLTRAEMLAPRQVKIKGVVTYKRGEEFSDFAMQDDTGGFIADLRDPEPDTTQLVPGQEIEIEGFTMIEPPPAPRIHVTKLVPGPVNGLPTPVPVTPQALIGGAGLFSYVEFSAVIRSTRIETNLEPHRLVLEFGPPEQRLSARLARFDAETMERLRPDARVRVRGTALAWTSVNLQPYSIFIGVHDPSHIELISPAENPESVPTLPIGELVSTHPEGFDARYQKVRGVVTLHWPGEMTVVQGETGAVRAVPASDADLRVGEEIDVAGFASASSGRIMLDGAVFSRPEPGRLPEPEKVGARRLTIEASSIDRESHLVQVDGVVIERGGREGNPLIRMEAEGKTFSVLLPERSSLPAGVLPGAKLAVTGVCHFIVGENARRFAIRLDGFEIHLADAAGIKVLSAPSWWTPGKLVGAIGVVLFVLGLSLLWGFTLRRRVAQRSALLTREIRARHDTQLLVAERSRLAADLHDTLSQTLSGAALQMEIADSLDGNSAENHRSLARRLLDRSREDLRRAVWDLTPSALLNQDLRAAFSSIAEDFGADHGCEIRVENCGEFPSLPERTRSHLLRVGQEAIHNAIRHGKATRVDVSFSQEAGNLKLEVKDNGGGFDPAGVPGPVEGHFGLASMRNRIQRLGGAFAVRTSPRGTVVSASVPLHSPQDDEFP